MKETQGTDGVGTGCHRPGTVDIRVQALGYASKTVTAMETVTGEPTPRIVGHFRPATAGS